MSDIYGKGSLISMLTSTSDQTFIASIISLVEWGMIIGVGTYKTVSEGRSCLMQRTNNVDDFMLRKNRSKDL